MAAILMLGMPKVPLSVAFCEHKAVRFLIIYRTYFKSVKMTSSQII